MITNVGYGSVFVLLLLESTVILGLFAPGVFALIGGSFLAGTHQLDAVTLFIVAWLAIALGDSLGFAIGRFSTRYSSIARLVDKLSSRVNIKQHSKFHRLVFYQFPVATRAPVPILLGAIRMRIQNWVLLETVATTLFVSVLFGLGYGTGATAGEADVAQRNANLLQIAFLVLLIVFIAIAVVRHRSRIRKHVVQD